MQAGQVSTAQSTFQQVIEESEPISEDLKIQQIEPPLDDAIQIDKPERKEKKEKQKKEKMKKINDDCNEYDSDSESDSDEEEDEMNCGNGDEMEKMEMKQKKDKKEMKEKEDCKEDKEEKKEKMKMKKKEKEMKIKKKEMEMKQTEADLEMMQRQQKLFDKVVQMWEDDRKAWIDREKVLLDQVKFLQSLQGTQQSTIKTPANLSETEEEEQNKFDFVSDVEKAMGSRTQENGQENIGDTMQVQIPSTGEELARAMGMVNQTDVMDDLDQFMRMPKRGQDYKQPQPQNISKNSTTEVSTQQVEEDTIAAPIVKETPSGPPPTLALESDDIFWVNQLQAALLKQGYYSGDDEMEDWFFGEQTQSALLTYQACAGLPETGTADEATWKSLLGEDLKPILPEGENSTPQTTSNLNSNSSNSSETKQQDLNSETIEKKESWPVMMEGDGGKEVHAMQTLLNKNGYYCGGEDVEWWQFGSTTMEALKSFQECSKLAVSGVCDPNSWKTLLGADANPSDIQKIQAGDDSDTDMSDSNGRIWLMGEQRWSEPSRLEHSKSN